MLVLDGRETARADLLTIVDYISDDNTEDTGAVTVLSVLHATQQCPPVAWQAKLNGFTRKVGASTHPHLSH